MLSAIRTRALVGAIRRPMVVSRAFGTTRMMRNAASEEKQVKMREQSGGAYSLEQVSGPESLIGAGSVEGEVPTDFDQATNLERLEMLGLMAGVKVFDHTPLDSSRKGTLENPIIVDSYEKYRYVGCTGSPAGSHEVLWMRPSADKVGRCWECGSVYKINYLGIEDEHHH
ncbi:cytochrome c oxidase subunit 4, mitochondrial [Trichomonascus vanleenenianus]|uniref:cytochrome c oxidase subunit IV n=1 Tax=Trichomonascus vanleenenianus TaxID=2268995 RepID=UPI003ECA0A4F